MSPNKMAVLISGRGTNLAALLEHKQKGDLFAEIAFVGSDNPEAKGLEIASSAGVETLLLPYERGKVFAENCLIEALEEHEVEWLVLAGFMRILSSRFVERFYGRIVNIHPALLPAFPGAHGIEEAWDYGVKVTGVTVHLVDAGVDSGPILAQEPVRVRDDDTLETLEERIHRTEHELYWRTLRDLFAGTLKPRERRTRRKDLNKKAKA